MRAPVRFVYDYTSLLYILYSFTASRGCEQVTLRTNIAHGGSNALSGSCLVTGGVVNYTRNFNCRACARIGPGPVPSHSCLLISRSRQREKNHPVPVQEEINSMEIERKWMVKGWPEESSSLPLVREQLMRQGYITVYPTVRIREETEKGGETDYILCFKSPPASDGLSRKEIEFPITQEQFSQLEDLIGYPLIPKLRRCYRLADGLLLEVNLVDEGMKTEFMYAEVEYDSEEQARNWDPADFGLSEYLSDDVTGQPGQTMGAYWQITRLHSAK